MGERIKLEWERNGIKIKEWDTWGSESLKNQSEKIDKRTCFWNAPCRRRAGGRWLIWERTQAWTYKKAQVHAQAGTHVDVGGRVQHKLSMAIAHLLCDCELGTRARSPLGLMSIPLVSGERQQGRTLQKL